MKKLQSLFIILVLHSSFFLTGCSNMTSKEKNLKNDLISAIEMKRGHKEQVLVKLQSITTFQWDRFYVFSPYTPINNIYDSLGYSWSEAVKSGIDHRDDINLLVFVKGGKVIKYLEYPRRHGDFYKIRKTNGFNPAEAIFEVKEENLGEPWLVLYEFNPSNNK